MKKQLNPKIQIEMIFLLLFLSLTPCLSNNLHGLDCSGLTRSCAGLCGRDFPATNGSTCACDDDCKV